MPAPLVVLGVAAAATAVVVVAASGSSKPEPLVAIPQAFPPVAEPLPPRAPVPGIDWHDAAGEFRVEAMARSPRFPPEPPGDTRVELATVADLAGARGKAFRIIADVYVEDTTDAASLVMLARSLKHAVQSGQKDRPDIVPTLHHTAWGERLARTFTLTHGAALPVPSSFDSGPLPTQLPTTPAVPRYVGKSCNTIEKNPSDWDELLAQWGVSALPAFYLFDTDACGERGPAYPERKSAMKEKYRARYNLRLEGAGSRVVLTAEVARLPLVQLLSWRVFYGTR